MGSLLPLSITTNCTMKSLLILATVLAVGHSEETKAAVVAPYHYGIPGYYGGVAAPFVGAPLNYAYAPQTAYPYTYAPYAQAYAQVAAPVAAPAPIVAAAPAVIPPVSSQFHAGDEFGNSQLSHMLPMSWDSELLTPDCPLPPFTTLSSQLPPFMTLSSQLLPFTNIPSPLLPFTNTPSLLLLFTMVLHLHPLKKLLRSQLPKLNILLP